LYVGLTGNLRQRLRTLDAEYTPRGVVLCATWRLKLALGDGS
jgi:hypothetical protein